MRVPSLPRSSKHGSLKSLSSTAPQCTFSTLLLCFYQLAELISWAASPSAVSLRMLPRGMLTLLWVMLAAASSSNFADVKFAKGMGSRGYTALRISVVSNGAPTADFAFDYSRPFQHRWTDYWLQSTVINATPGVPQVLNLGRAGNVTVPSLPAEGAAVRGIFLGDPCTEPGFVGCIHFNGTGAANMSTRLPRLFNAITDVDFRVVLGDNLYDSGGAITQRFHTALTPAARQLFSLTVPGNHDYWTVGAPLGKTKKDQFGNGFMQYYAQDVVAGRGNASTTPFDFTVDPDTKQLPPASNFAFYHKIGDTGFIGFSGAHTKEDHIAFFEEACAYFDESVPRPAIIFALGHWSEAGLGAPIGMSTPAVFGRLSKLRGCDRGTLRYAMGHTHCNRVDRSEGAALAPVPPASSTPATKAQMPVGTHSNRGVEGEAIGYLLGGTGVRGDYMGCNTFGFAYYESGARELVVGFTLAENDADQYDHIVNCFEMRGISNCLSLGTVWRNSSMSRGSRHEL